MKSILSLLFTAALPALITAKCTILGKTTITFYGFPDNSPPGPATAHNCAKRNFTASTGEGTFENPGTMATAPGEFAVCEIIYVPYLKKYVRYEDDCEQCITDHGNGIRHIDIWTGSPTVNGKQDQINCEDNLTLAPQSRTIIRNPAKNYPVDSTPLYVKGKTPSCRLHHTYPNDNAIAHKDCPA